MKKGKNQQHNLNKFTVPQELLRKLVEYVISRTALFLCYTLI